MVVGLFERRSEWCQQGHRISRRAFLWTSQNQGIRQNLWLNFFHRVAATYWISRSRHPSTYQSQIEMIWLVKNSDAVSLPPFFNGLLTIFRSRSATVVERTNTNDSVMFANSRSDISNRTDDPLGEMTAKNALRQRHDTIVQNVHTHNLPTCPEVANGQSKPTESARGPLVISPIEGFS